MDVCTGQEEVVDHEVAGCTKLTEHILKRCK